MTELPDLQRGEACLLDWSAGRYHMDKNTTSRSALEDLRFKPSLYYAKHEARTMASDHETPAMILGTHVHLCVLEPEEWRRRLYQPEPYRPPHAKGNAKKDSPERIAYAEWKAEYEKWQAGIESDSIVLSPEDTAKVEAIAESVRSHPFARLLLESEGQNEQTILWREPETGLLVRVRLDRLSEIDETAKTILDLKTTTSGDPRQFGKSIARFGYHRQGAIYRDATQALYPDAEIHYALAVVETSPPYDTAVYELSEDALEHGRTQYLETMHDLVRRRAENDWLAWWQRGCVTIDLPGWAYMETEA